MNYVTVNPRRNRKNSDFLFPHFGNILNEVMRTSVSDIIKADSDKTKFTVPAVNVKELADQFLLEMAIPGLNKKDININVEGEKLIISAELPMPETSNNYALKEFNYNSFKRSFTLPESVDQSKINANFMTGILTISMAKKEEKVDKGPQKIKIS